ncbi:Pectate lyase superfamily protein [compost metagenome]
MAISRYGGVTGSKNINEDFENINVAFNNVAAESDTNKSVVDNHLISNQAHAAAQITYGPSSVKQALDDANTGIDVVNDRIDNLIITGGDSSPEVADARGGYSVLGGRLNAFDAQFIDIAYSAKVNGLKGDGVTNDYSALNAMLTNIGATKAQIYFGKGTYIIGSNITIPPNVKLIFANGAMLSPNTGVTITINGPIDAGVYQIFGGNGTITGSPKVDSVYPQWFGAVADASTDCSSAFQKALNFAKGIPVRVICGESSYVFNNHITMTTNNTLIGEGRNSFIYCRSKYFIKIAGNNCTVDGFVINMNEAPSGGSAIRIDTSTQVISNTRIANIRFYACHNSISDVQGGSFINDVIIERCYTWLDKGEQFTLWYTQGFVTLREVVVDRSSNAYPVNWNGISIHSFGGLELEKVDVLGPTSVLTPPVYQPGYGIYIKGDPALSPTIWLTRVLIDNIMQDGLYIENVKNIVCNNVMVYQAFGIQMRLTNVQYGQFLNTFIVGSKGITGAPSTQAGLIMKDCSNLQFSELIINDNNSHGLYMDTVTDCNFNNVQIKNNGGWGKIDAQLCDRNITTNARVSGNTSGSVFQLGAASAFCNWIANAGTFRVNDVGAFSQ